METAIMGYILYRDYISPSDQNSWTYQVPLLPLCSSGLGGRHLTTAFQHFLECFNMTDHEYDACSFYMEQDSTDTSELCFGFLRVFGTRFLASLGWHCCLLQMPQAL